MKIEIPILRSKHAEEIPLPTYMTEHAAGMDVYAACDENIILKPGERFLVPSGFSIALPVGYEAQIRPRSGLAIKNGVTCLNSPGTIDADYRGEIKVILINLGQEDFKIQRGDRIAQMVVHKVERVEWLAEERLSETARNAGGFGSTGS